ncbi:AAA family ATPase [Streptomyces swartbergensis]|uniref:Orc1-like AAA ATPase domain-containing protein n=1 Tax=Streptomyces swartbergensis TaxID=487165 RepID=A0A243S791_9ACTN|nr:AAA family ATPase [Streptomyces swartbergensis]OUD03462.1 hypothetical protein CA983_09490 [Streptomyces swartbergensis]
MEQHLRGPTPPPDTGEIVGRLKQLQEIDEWLRQHPPERPSPDRGRPPLLVLHGPAGIGKSALAARACRRHSSTTHWITLYDATRADVEPTLLRLLGESGAARAAIVRAAADDGRGFRRTLRHELAQRLRGRLLVLDGAAPPVVRALMSFLRHCPGLTVLVTSRRRTGWRRTGAKLLAVPPLSNWETWHFLAGNAAGSGRRSLELFWPGVVRGLPPLARVARALMADGMPRQWEQQADEPGPRWLVRLAVAGCTPGEQDMLRRLAEQNSAAPFTLRSVESLYLTDQHLPDVRSLLAGLVARELVQRWHGDDSYCLPEPVAEAVRRPGRPDRASAAVWAGRVLQDTAGLLDGRARPDSPSGREPERVAPRELVPDVDGFMALLTGDRGSRAQQDRIADGLAVLLGFLGDAHRLVALHRLRPTPPVRRALGSLAADLGLPQLAVTLFDAGSRVGPDAVHQSVVHHQSGRLGGALDVLEPLLREDAGPQDGHHRAWALTVLGAIRCDRGEVAEAEQALLRATTQHRSSGCWRGLGWALLHSARVCLLTGREADAARLLAEADKMLLRVADTRGRNWVMTERIRVALRRGGSEAALGPALQARQQHRAAEDVRGMAWTSLYLALVHLEENDLRSAYRELRTAETYFLECGDELGSAWAKHRIALLPLADSRNLSAPPLVSLGPAWDLFVEIGCPLGTAWTELEMAARRQPSELTLPLLSMAWEGFRALGDVSGQTWAAAVEGLVRKHLALGGPRTAKAFTASVPHDIPNREQLVRELTWFWEGEGEPGGRGIPFRARDTVVVRDTSPGFLDLPGPAAPRCHVRVTLLDDTPGEDTTARLLLRVSPENGHPWAASAGDRPWLTVTAVPLTRASVDPASALLRPSEQAGHGAEFRFTAHSTGTHRIRFTIALESTGTVLQQVETELDILDQDRRGGLSSPEAVTHRGR